MDLDPNIQIAADFDIDTPQYINYATTISSAEGGPHTLTKSGGTNFSMFTVQDGGSLTLENIVLDGAKATIATSDDSPLVSAHSGTLIAAAGAVLQNNPAPGITALDSSNATVTVIIWDNAVIRGNEARNAGGGIQAAFWNPDSSLRISGQARIENNTTNLDGGGIGFSGGAQQHLIIEDNVRITGNSAVNGAGIMVYGGSMSLRGQVEISSNRGETLGGIYFRGNNLLVEEGVTIRDNLASNKDSTGGGICLLPETPSTISIRGLIDSNTAARGGGVYVNVFENATLDFTGARFNGNQALDAAGSGGGLCINLRADNETPLPITLQSTIFTANTAAGSGGGLSIVVPGETGGAAPFVLNAKDSEFQDNTAALDGGGVSLILPGGSAALFQGGEFLRNEAASGAGLYAAFWDNNPFSLMLEGVSFSTNQAREDGGGIFVSGSDGSTAKLSDCTIDGNTGNQGGGIYFSHQGSGEGALTLESVNMSGNHVQKSGGAIFLGQGGIRADLIQLFLSNNGALDGAGGGLYSAGGTGRISIQFDSDIRGNSAVSGGGIYHAGDRVLALYNVYFLDNIVAATGVDIYNDGPLELHSTEDPSVELGVVRIRDGLYLLNRDAVPTLIERPARNSVVQLERSEYVFPDQTGDPIVVAAFHEPLSAEDASVFRKPVSGFDGWEIRLESEGFEVVLAPVEYTIRYENTQDAGNPNPNSYTALTPTITLLPLTDRTGYRFTGWFDALEGGVQVTEILTGSTGDKTLYARWQRVHTVTYYGNDAGGPAAENLPLPLQVPDGENALLSEKRPTRAGYAFTGWNTGPGGSGAGYPSGGTIPNVLADVGLYAQWEALPPIVHLVTYEPNDAGGPSAQNMPEPQRFLDGQIAYLSAMIPTRTGFRFQNWNTQPDGYGDAYQAGQILETIYADLTLYAQWQYVDYTLTYHGNDEGGPPAQNIPIQQYFHVELVFQLSDAVPTREGYRFTAWNTRPDGGGTTYQPSASFGPTIGDADLYAQWEAIPPALHLLTYEPNDAGGPSAENIPDQEEVTEGETTALSAAVPTRTGYRFLGWNDAPDGTGTAYRPGQTAGPFYDDLTIYAQWERVEHMLTYHGNDEAGPPAQWIPFPHPVPEGIIISLPEVIPTREGFRFTGWNTRPDGDETAYRPGEPFGPIFADTGLYAQWVVIPPSIHTLTYYGNDAGGPAAQNIPGPVPVLDGQNVTLLDTIPTREGFTFSGWNTDPAGTGAAYRPGDTIYDVREDIGLYAQWIPLPPPICYTLTYCGNDSGRPPACCIPCPQQVHTGQCVRISCYAPYRACYCFTSWNTDPCGRGQVVCPGQLVGPITGDVRLYAQWRHLPPPNPCCTCHRVPD